MTALEEEDRALLPQADKERLLEILLDLQTQARAITDKMKQTPGGDAYVYDGSMNSVDRLRDACQAWDEYERELLPDDDEPPPGGGDADCVHECGSDGDA